MFSGERLKPGGGHWCPPEEPRQGWRNLLRVLTADTPEGLNQVGSHEQTCEQLIFAAFAGSVPGHVMVVATAAAGGNHLSSPEEPPPS